MGYAKGRSFDDDPAGEGPGADYRADVTDLWLGRRTGKGWAIDGEGQGCECTNSKHAV